MNMSFVIAPAGADRSGPARVAVSLTRDVVVHQELALLRPIDALCDGSDGMFGGSGEAMAERDVPVRSYAHKPEPRATTVRLTHALMDLLKRVFNV